MGRKAAEIDWGKLNGMLLFKATKDLCASELGVSKDKLHEDIRKRYGMTFQEYADKILDKTRWKLQNKAITLALGGNVSMLIFCLKNICKWSDRVETTLSEDSKPIVLKYGFDKKDVEEIKKKAIKASNKKPKK